MPNATQKLPVVFKPVTPSGIWNGLLSAKLNGLARGSFKGELTMRDKRADDFPDSPHRGHTNDAYDSGVIRLSELDPTALMVRAKQVRLRDTTQGRKGQTHVIALIEYVSAISSELTQFVEELNVLAYLAKEEQEARKDASQSKRIDSFRSTAPYAGAIATYLAAVGPIHDSVIGWSRTTEIDVVKIHEIVISRINAYLDILDGEAIEMTKGALSGKIGIGSMPSTQASVAVMSAALIDMDRFCWKRVLIHPQAREELKSEFISRIPEPKASDTVHSVFVLAEGGDQLVLPCHPGTHASVWDRITYELDNMPPMSDSLYGSFSNDWRDQFRTQGDLISAIYVHNTVDPFYGSSLEVLPGPFHLDKDNIPVLGTVAGTGALHSINNYATSFSLSYIAGTNNIPSGGYAGYKFDLPQGIMRMNSPAFATAIQWIELLLKLQQDIDPMVKEVMSIAKRGRRKAFSASPSPLGSGSALLQEMVTNSLRDGYIPAAPAVAGFNRAKPERAGNQGPVLYGTTDGANLGHAATPVPISGLDKWDEADASSDVSLTRLDGTTSSLRTMQRITGEWSSQRISGLALASVPDTQLHGNEGPIFWIAESLLSTPLYLDSSTGSTVIRGIAENTAQVARVSASDAISHSQLLTLANLGPGPNPGEANGQYNHYHPIYGFMRGLALYIRDSGVNGVLAGTGHFRKDYSSNNRLLFTGYDANGAAVAPKGVLVLNQAYTGEFVPAAVSSAQVSVAKLKWRSTQPITIMQPTLLDDGTGVKNGTAAAREMCVWHWDPQRTQILGEAWHQWGGELFTDVLMHPYVTQPYRVSTCAAELRDLNTDIRGTSERQQGAIVIHIGGGPSSSFGNQGLHKDGLTTLAMHDSIALSSVGPQGSKDFKHGVCINQGHYKLQVNSAFAQQHVTKMRAVHAIAPLDAATKNGTTIEGSIPAFLLNLQVTNGCAPGGLLRSTANPSLGNHQGWLDFPVQLLDPAAMAPIPHILQGEQIAFNSGDSNVTAISIVSGPGLLPEADVASANLLDFYSHLVVKPYQETFEKTQLTSAPSAITGETGQQPYAGAILPVPVGAARNAAIAAAYNMKDVPSVANQWFRRSTQISQARLMRRRATESPWERADAKQMGLVTVSYDRTQLAGKFDEIKKILFSLGSKLLVGLDDNMWYELNKMSL